MVEGWVLLLVIIVASWVSTNELHKYREMGGRREEDSITRDVSRL